MGSRARRGTVALVASIAMAAAGLGGAAAASAEKPAFHTCRISAASGPVEVTVPVSVYPGPPGQVACRAIPA